MPCRARTLPRPCRSESDFSRPRHSAAWAWRCMCELASAVQKRQVVTCWPLASSGCHAEFHECCYRKHTNPLNCRTSSLDISGYHPEFHEGCYQKHTDPLNCRTSSSDISGYHPEFHEGCYQKHTNTLNCRTSSSDIPATTRTFTKDTELSENGRGVAWLM
jgi:hypothetical protein